MIKTYLRETSRTLVITCGRCNRFTYSTAELYRTRRIGRVIKGGTRTVIIPDRERSPGGHAHGAGAPADGQRTAPRLSDARVTARVDVSVRYGAT
jgi:hypothetical protein